MITSNKVFKMVNLLRKARQEKDFAEIDMFEARTRETSCGTICCHGGLYAIAKGLNLSRKTLGADFQNGAGLMAEDLGFLNTDSLKGWAEANPQIWGNICGSAMFYSRRAFFPEDRDEITVDDIINHWEEVGMRLYMEERL